MACHSRRSLAIFMAADRTGGPAIAADTLIERYNAVLTIVRNKILLDARHLR
jgi:hypothetical protein